MQENIFRQSFTRSSEEHMLSRTCFIWVAIFSLIWHQNRKPVTILVKVLQAVHTSRTLTPQKISHISQFFIENSPKKLTLHASSRKRIASLVLVSKTHCLGMSSSLWLLEHIYETRNCRNRVDQESNTLRGRKSRRNGRNVFTSHEVNVARDGRSEERSELSSATSLFGRCDFSAPWPSWQPRSSFL